MPADIKISDQVLTNRLRNVRSSVTNYNSPLVTFLCKETRLIKNEPSLNDWLSYCKELISFNDDTLKLMNFDYAINNTALNQLPMIKEEALKFSTTEVSIIACKNIKI